MAAAIRRSRLAADPRIQALVRSASPSPHALANALQLGLYADALRCWESLEPRDLPEDLLRSVVQAVPAQRWLAAAPAAAWPALLLARLEPGLLAAHPALASAWVDAWEAVAPDAWGRMVQLLQATQQQPHVCDDLWARAMWVFAAPASLHAGPQPSALVERMMRHGPWARRGASSPPDPPPAALQAFARAMIASDPAKAAAYYTRICPQLSSVQRADSAMCLLQAAAAAGSLSLASKHWRELERQAPARAQSTAGYNELMRAAAERGLQGDALLVYKRMRARGLGVDQQTLHWLMTAFCRSRDLRSTIHWFYKKSDADGFAPSPDMHGTLIAAHVACGESVGAYRALHAAVRSCVVYPNAQLAPLSMVGLRALAKDLAGKHMDYLRDRLKLVRADTVARPHILQELMRGANALGNRELALQLFGEFSSDSGCGADCAVPAGALVAAIEAHAPAVDSTPAVMDLFDRVLDDESATQHDRKCAVDGVLQHLAAVAQAASNETTPDADTRLKMIELAGKHPDAVTLRTLEILASVSGDSDDISRLIVDQAVSGGHIPNPALHTHLAAAFKKTNTPWTAALGIDQ